MARFKVGDIVLFSDNTAIVKIVDIDNNIDKLYSKHYKYTYLVCREYPSLLCGTFSMLVKRADIIHKKLLGVSNHKISRFYA